MTTCVEKESSRWSSWCCWSPVYTLYEISVLSLVHVLGIPFSPRLCCRVLQSGLAGDHSDCVKAICGGDD